MIPSVWAGHVFCWWDLCKASLTGLSARLSAVLLLLDGLQPPIFTVAIDWLCCVPHPHSAGAHQPCFICTQSSVLQRIPTVARQFNNELQVHCKQLTTVTTTIDNRTKCQDRQPRRFGMSPPSENQLTRFG